MLFRSGPRGQGGRGKGRRLPARALPFECYHVAAIGMEFLLGAVCFGASQVAIVATERDAEAYVAALRSQMAVAEAILHGLGYEGEHFVLVDGDALEEGLWALVPAATVAKAATFHLSPEKRTSLDLCFDALARGGREKPAAIPLPAGAAFGAITVDPQACTLCKACVGACPESALLDAQDAPELR